MWTGALDCLELGHGHVGTEPVLVDLAAGIHLEKGLKGSARVASAQLSFNGLCMLQSVYRFYHPEIGNSEQMLDLVALNSSDEMPFNV